MIPILYAKTETAFLSNGIGRLVDCISCIVTEERNGVYECEFQYPANGRYYDQLMAGGTISVTHNDNGDRQPFDIYRHSVPINGIVTFNARHISYRLSKITVAPYNASSCLTALEGIGTNAMQTCQFSFWTDKSVSSNYKVEVPSSARALLNGEQGSILDIYGKGEYEFDKFDVKLYTNRGADNGVTIRYGKNLSDIMDDVDEGETFNAIAPYWQGVDTVVKLPEGYVLQTGATEIHCVPMDFSAEYDEAPTEAQLRIRANKYLADNEPWIPDRNITIDFVQLWQTEEYKDYALLEKVKLCDTVHIVFPSIGTATSKVIRTEWDVLRERYSKIELGKAATTLQEAVLYPVEKQVNDLYTNKVSNAELAAAIQHATELITGVDGGHVIIETDSDGEPQEILIMDTDDKTTAVNVWRWNLNGLGHSHTGYNGPYNDVAITMDGKINASMILTGYLVANIIKGGTLTLGGNNNEDGIWVVLDANGNEVARGDKDGVTSKALTATEYVYINGGEGSYLRIPLNGNDPTSEYIEISDDATQPFHVRLGADTPNNFFEVLINSFGLQVAESFFGIVNKSAITYNGLKVSSDADSSSGFYSLLYMQYIDSAGTKRFKIGPSLPPYSGEYEIRINDSNGALWATISPSYWTGEPELQLVGHNGNDDIILSPGVGLQIGSTTGTKRFRIGPTLPPYSGDYEIRINDSNGALWAKISPSYWTGEPELQLVGHNGNGDIILSPGVGLQIGSTTLNETQLQQLLALI